MGRVANAQRTTHRSASIVDRSADGGFHPAQRPSGTPPVGPARTGPILPASRDASPETPTPETLPSGQLVTLEQLWFQLSVPDRQRFGHCFSAMVLKALGLRPAPTQEVNS
jgi:hypothetical protein